MMWLAAMLILHPVVDEPTDLRIVAEGVGDANVEWHLDGLLVATTGEREAARITIGAGSHELRARAPVDGAWQIMARPEPAGVGAQYVTAWTASHAGTPTVAEDARPAPWFAIPLLAFAVGLVAVPRLIDARRKPRQIDAGAAIRCLCGACRESDDRAKHP